MIRYVIVAVLVALSSGQSKDFEFEDCGSKAKILSAQIEPCDSDPCILKRGSTSKVHFSIVSDQDSETAVLEGKFKMFGFMLPIPGLESNLCTDVIQCPIVEGQTFGGTMEVSIPFLTPPMKTAVQLKISGDQGTSVCLRTNVIVQ
ncbi:mite group 2 allergen-like Ixo r 2 [Amblyomma americanum]